MLTVFQTSFMQVGLIASLLISIACGYLSVYVILKRLVFLAVALAQFASAAVAISLYADINPMLAAFIGVMIGSLIFSIPAIGRYLPKENAIGTAYALTSAAGVILIAKNAQGEEHLLNLLYGNILTAEINELYIMGMIIIFAGGLLLTFSKEFMFSSFDAEVARTLGINTKLWEVLFNLSLGLVIAMAIRLGGMMLVFSFLVLPGYAALLTKCRIKISFIMAVVMAVLSGVLGLYLSFIWDLPASSVTIAILSVTVIVCGIIGSIRTAKKI
jgi:ABC-type Mn2+/Zn2+ transport system permease subunit